MRFILLLFTPLIFSVVNAQNSTCSCIENIDFMISELEDSSASYKLIPDKTKFTHQVDSIKRVVIEKDVTFNCIQYLNIILRSIQDGHLKVFPKNNVNFKDEESVRTFLKSKKFNSRPVVNFETDYKEHIYYSYADNIRILIDEYSPNQYRGIAIDSTSRYWKKGEVVLEFKKANGFFSGVRYTVTKNPAYYKTKTFNNLLKKFRISVHKKEALTFYNPIKEKLSIKIIDQDILYVSIKSFQNITKEHQIVFDRFFKDELLPNYDKYSKIIFDVRDNSGGAKVYGILFKKLKRQKAKKRIVVLQNRSTASAAELFILDLKAIKEITTLGEYTSGMTAFRHIVPATFPCNDMILWRTIKPLNRRYKDYLKYEYYGLKPDIELSETTDWIKSAINELNKSL